MKTIIKNKTTEIIIKKSKFLAFSYKVVSKQDIKRIIEYNSKEHKQAKHICFAYSLINNGVTTKKYYESIEPNGSSGKQIYNLIEKFDLINVLVIVVRYYGGSKLGFGLLSRTYLDAAKSVLINNIEKYVKKQEVTIVVPINRYNFAIRYLTSNNIKILKKTNNNLTFEIPENFDINCFFNKIKN